MSAEMFSRQAHISLDVEFVNNTSDSTLRFFHRTGFLSSQRKELITLPPPSGDVTSSFVFRYEDGTNESIEVEYKVEVDNGSSTVRRRSAVQETYKRINVLIDSDMLLENSKIIVVDFEAGPNGAAVSSENKFILQTVARAQTLDAGWLATVVMALYVYGGFKYVLWVFKYLFSGLTSLSRLIAVTELQAQHSEPTAQVPSRTVQVPARTVQASMPTGQVPEIQVVTAF